MTAKSLDRRTERIERLLRHPDSSPELFEDVLDVLDEIAPDLAYLEREDGFRFHVIHKLSEYASDDDTESCTCTSPNCPIKKGVSPPSIEMSSDEWEKSVEEYIAEHPGIPHALVDARETWQNKVRRVERALDSCTNALQKDDPTFLNSIYD